MKNIATALLKILQTNKIPSLFYYPKPLHMQTAFSILIKKGDFRSVRTVLIASLVYHASISYRKKDQEEILRDLDKRYLSHEICTIVGARPQFIKAAAISRAMAEHNRLNQTLHASPKLLFIPGSIMMKACLLFFFENWRFLNLSIISALVRPARSADRGNAFSY